MTSGIKTFRFIVTWSTEVLAMLWTVLITGLRQEWFTTSLSCTKIYGLMQNCIASEVFRFGIWSICFRVVF